MDTASFKNERFSAFKPEKSNILEIIPGCLAPGFFLAIKGWVGVCVWEVSPLAANVQNGSCRSGKRPKWKLTDPQTSKMEVDGSLNVQN